MRLRFGRESIQSLYGLTCSVTMNGSEQAPMAQRLRPESSQSASGPRTSPTVTRSGRKRNDDLQERCHVK